MWDTFWNLFPKESACTPQLLSLALEWKILVYVPTECKPLKRGLPKGNYSTGNIWGQKCKTSGAWERKKTPAWHKPNYSLKLHCNQRWSQEDMSQEARSSPHRLAFVPLCYSYALPLITSQASRWPSASLYMWPDKTRQPSLLQLVWSCTWHLSAPSTTNIRFPSRSFGTFSSLIRWLRPSMLSSISPWLPRSCQATLATVTDRIFHWIWGCQESLMIIFVSNINITCTN